MSKNQYGPLDDAKWRQAKRGVLDFKQTVRNKPVQKH